MVDLELQIVGGPAIAEAVDGEMCASFGLSIADVETDDADDDAAAFAERLLIALSAMAARSKRGQADLTAVLCAAGIPADPGRVRAALGRLQAQGCVQNLVPLSDGGMLLSVTPNGGRFGSESQWLPVNQPRAMARA